MSDQPGSLAAALADLQQHLPRIGKDAQAQYGRYADLADVTRALLPELGKRGFSWTCLPTMIDEGFRLQYILQHVPSRESLEGFYPLPATGNPQQIGSAITYARRYCLLAVTGAAPDEDDDDAQAAEDAARAQRRMPPETRDDGSATDAELTRMQYGHEPGAWRSNGTAENDPHYDQPPPEPAEDQPASIAKRQLSIMHAKFSALGITEREKRLRWTEVVIGRPVKSANELSYVEAETLLEALTQEARDRATA